MADEIMNEAAPVEPDVAEQPETSDARKALVGQWCSRIKDTKAHHAKQFKLMRDNEEFARLGATKEWHESGKYTVPIIARHINQTVSALYARNPKTVAERRPRLMYRLWDGRSDTLQAAMEMGAMGDPNATAIVQEVLQVRQQTQMLDRMAQTLQYLWEYYLDEQGANYKQQLKAAVRRAKTCKVAYIKLGYQRILEPRPETMAEITDITSKIANVEAALAMLADDKLDDASAEMEQLRLNLADLERDKMMVVREGPVLSFPRADQLIIDKACYHLKSLSGAGWVAEEFEMTPKEIKKTYKVDIKSDFKWYAPDGNPYDKKPEECTARVYQVWDKDNLQTFTVCEGYDDFLAEPATPEVWTERFWPYFPIVFNEIEHHSELYPQSDVEHAQHIQNEYNRSREALRQHRVAARPFYVTAKGLDQAEKDKLAFHADHAIIEMPTLASGQKVEDLIQRGPTAPIDPNLYEVNMVFQDLLRAVGAQEANLGGSAGGTATETSIAEQSRSVSQSDNVDDLDEVLTELARAAGQVMLLNVEKETVMEIVGPGAVWPESPEMREEAAKEIMLKVQAGSSGRPNRAAELANMERGMPYIVQLPNMNPEPIGKKYLSLLDIDTEEAFADGMPSITAMNAMMAKMGATQPGTGDPETDPAAQGGEGGQNAPVAPGNEPGPQPAYTAPSPVG